jgi:large subunit ribosomal protein L4
MQLLQSSFVGLGLGSDCAHLARKQTQRQNVALQKRQIGRLSVQASIVSEPATLDVKTLDGASSGTASLSLRVAEPDTSKGLVHRYIVMVRQNMRQVSPLERGVLRRGTTTADGVESIEGRPIKGGTGWERGLEVFARAPLRV